VESTTRRGSFCTSVLKTSAPDRAATFYTSLVGWTTVPATADHTFLQFNGATVASLHRVEGPKDEWVPHVLVGNIETTVADAATLGAVLVDRHDIEGVARIATLRDLEGAAFGLWQAEPHAGAEVTDGLGSIWWIELLSRDIVAGRDFYGRLFGWTVRETSFEPVGLYRVFERPPTQEGGLNQIRPEWELAPVWLTTVAVNDCDQTMARACEIGGEAGFVHTVPKHGRIGSIFDPGGACLSLRGPVPAATG
jgi:predicted enzyme related to lactoylglutathione lyase